MLVINADRAETHTLEVPVASERYTLTAANLMDKQVQLNGIVLKLGAQDALPDLRGTTTQAGKMIFASTSITFLELPMANNASCQP